MRLWSALPTMIRAVLTGIAVGFAGTFPWAFLVGQNIRHGSSFPWAVPLTAVYLWFFWQYFVRGKGWPRQTSETRRTSARANEISGDVWGAAILAGLLGLVGVLLLQGLIGRMVALPPQRELDPSQYPLATVFLWLVMSAIVAGVTEETAFRGYLQRPIERRHGPLVAILIAGVLFGFIHFSHPEVGLVLLPYYIAVSAVYGMLAYLTDSIWPSLVLHAGGNMFSALDLFTRGRTEWQLTVEPAPLIWTTGPDAAFWGTLIGFLAVGGAALWAYAGLARVAREHRAVV
jgi:membrane protease YdiL (CAAX protease family)